MSHITIFSASIGSGHNEASKALKKQLETKGHSVTIVDTFYAIHPLLHKVFFVLYLSMIKRAPNLWGRLYKYGADYSWFLIMDKLGGFFCDKLYSIISEQNTNIMVSTHPFVTAFLSNLKKKHCLHIPLYTVITDLDLHPGYIRPEIDAYFTGAPNYEVFAKEYNVPCAKFHFTGIPIKTVPDPLLSRYQVRERLGLVPNEKTVLLTGGGLGLGKYVEIIKSLEGLNSPVQLVCMTGVNKKITRKVKSIVSKHRIHVLEFTDHFIDYLRASDVILSKAGGLTMSEALACETPILVYKPVPGHEENNATILTEMGTAIKADKLSDIIVLLERLLFDHSFYKSLVQNAKKTKTPHAASHIANVITSMPCSRVMHMEGLHPPHLRKP
ncbi:glycosyltransferase [Alkalihalophilus lindianensis]|uniref:Glycosyltransferase n=1 Tax=Alkalihalophilus lindianensis TaxID=1630542 RepID=A0ABU3XAZ5_9BACI|nr:glycosyltransferase [Alkalihalophilus lindianensis]MDV2685054.1 glycosyltransferase [Alkalihalophilus lindianensis]